MTPSGVPATAQVGRVAVVMQDFSGGGAERMMLNIAQGLVDRGHRVDMVVVRNQGPYAERVPDGVDTVVLGPSRVSRAIPSLARYFRERRPDAALSTLVHMNVAASLASLISRSPVRLVVREAVQAGLDSRAEARPLIRLAYALAPMAYRRAHHIIAISEGLAVEVRQRTALPVDRVTAVHNPVLSSSDWAAIERHGPAPHPWLADEELPTVVAVGRLEEQKDHETLLQALALVKASRPCRLLLLGEGSLRERLERRVIELGLAGDVSFVGFTHDPFSWIKHADLFVHTARWEGFGNVIVEALACGIPVVATDCPSGPREILGGGRFGELVPVGDPGAVAQAMVRTLGRPPDPAELVERARSFTVEAVVPIYERILLGNESAGSDTQPDLSSNR